MYKFWPNDRLTTEQQKTIIACINSGDRKLKKSTKVLGGRGTIKLCQIAGLGQLVIKTYQRGGLLSKLNRSYYLRARQSRPKIEYEALEFCLENQINVPEPVVTLTRGRLFYRGWLVIRHVENLGTLADLSTSNPEIAMKAVASLAVEIYRLIDLSYLHIDLHPGNVILGLDQQPILLDFDKSEVFKGGKLDLRDLYLLRWRRAVIKHQLPEFLTELMSAKLRAYGR